VQLFGFAFLQFGDFGLTVCRRGRFSSFSTDDPRKTTPRHAIPSHSFIHKSKLSIQLGPKPHNTTHNTHHINIMLAASTPHTLSRDEEENQWLHSLLQQQSQHVEEYCNGQTRLQNALIEEDRTFQASSIQTNIVELDQTLRNVQKDLKNLKMKQLHGHRRKEVLSDHIQTSERVLLTIWENGGMLHPNGIPASKDNVAIKTVALSSLRASIAQVQRKLGI
jgi:hypothetical protein